MHGSERLYTNIKATRIVGICALLILALFLARLVRAQESSGAAGVFLRMGVGARPLGLGGAFTGVANDASATYWNPAGLPQMRRLALEFMNANLPFDRRLNFLSAVVPVRGVATLGVSWTGLSVGGLEARTGNTAEPDFTFGSTQNAFLLSAGRRINPWLAIGASAKFLQTSLAQYGATGFGFDAAVLLYPMDGLQVGFVVQDVGTDLRWGNNFTEGVPLNFRLGASYQAYDGILVAADVSKGPDPKPSFHVGVELRPAQVLPLRVGWDDQSVTGGAGFVFALAEHALAVNYSYGLDPAFNQGIHRVSLSFTLNARRRARIAESDSPPIEWSGKAYDAGDRVEVTARVLNVRGGPGTSYAVIGKVYRGERLKVVERRGRWRKIRLKSGKEGWVHGNYVRPIR